MTIKGAVNFVGVCSMVCDAGRMAIIPSLTSLKPCERFLMRRAKVCKDRRIVVMFLVRVCRVFCVVSQDAVCDSNFFSRTVQFSAGRNVRNQLKLVVWNCKIATDVL